MSLERECAFEKASYTIAARRSGLDLDIVEKGEIFSRMDQLKGDRTYCSYWNEDRIDLIVFIFLVLWYLPLNPLILKCTWNANILANRNTIQRPYLSLAIQPIPQRLAFDGGDCSPLYTGARDLWWRLSLSSPWSKIIKQVSAGSASRQLTRSPTLMLVLIGNKKLAEWCNACNNDGYVHFFISDFWLGCVYT